VDFKDLYGARNFGRHRVLFGLSPSPTFDLIESFWGYRYLARTAMDLQGIASRDTGVAANGPLNASETLSYRAMVGAGVEFGAETGDRPKWMGALTWKPSSRWILDFYVDFENLDGSRDRVTGQFFAGYKTDTLRWGVQYSNQDRQDDPPLELASVFAIGQVGEKSSLVGRIDRILEPSPLGDNIPYLPFDPSARATFFLGGVQFQVTPHLIITPNTAITFYDENEAGVTPDTDFHLRVTFYLNHE